MDDLHRNCEHSVYTGADQSYYIRPNVYLCKKAEDANFSE